jgi:ZIP family zinc transporter
MSDVMIALALSTLAGLSTVIGALLAFTIRRPRRLFLPVALGFSAGVMLYISFVEMFPEALTNLPEELAVGAFFLGILFIAVIDLLIPKWENPHHFAGARKHRRRYMMRNCNPTLMRLGLFTAVAITIHNFPEGMATFATALSNIELGIVIALAIALHNIPEGVSVAVPIYCATGSKKKALKYSFISGLAEPLGAIIAYIILLPFLNAEVLAMLLAFVAGIMVYISIDEIIPTAHNYGKSHVVIVGVILGMLVMAVSLFML